RLAREHGATLRDHAPVTSIRTVEGELEVIAGDTIYRCEKLILTTDAWSNQMLAHFGLRLPLTLTQEQVTYFASPHLEDFQPDRFPIWIWLDVPCFYGFPAYGEPGPKVAEDVGGQEVTVDTRTFEPDPAIQQRMENFLQSYLPGALGRILYTKTCLYTLTPDRNFVVDALPSRKDVFLGLGAAHGFKFASLAGKILSELAIDGETDYNIQPFKFDRPILTMENPPKNFMT
ncbi:MAG: FAD-dependent oxidoreductase, partial [Anaerolineales bacterium]